MDFDGNIDLPIHRDGSEWDALEPMDVNGNGGWFMDVDGNAGWCEIDMCRVDIIQDGQRYTSIDYYQTRLQMDS